MSGTITSVTLTLNGLGHAVPQDYDIGLVGPTGASTFIMSDVGGFTAVTNRNLTFDNCAASSLSGATFASGTYRPTNRNDNDGTDTFTAPAPSFSATPNLATFLGTDPNGTWRLYVRDDFPTSDGGSISTGWALTITTGTANTAPVNTVPAAQTTDDDTARVFSSANANAISISDAEAGASAVRVTLTATSGQLTLAGTTGLTFSVGTGSSDATMTFTGTIANVNAALNGLSFQPTEGALGTGSVQIQTHDQDTTGTCGLTDTDTVSIAITGCSGLNTSGDTDSDATCNDLDSDDDNDGIADGSDSSSLNPDVCGDSDSDTCDDCAVGSDNFGALSDSLPANDGTDTDGDGLCDAGDACNGSNASGDTDSDGTCNNLDSDDDNDGVADGSDSSSLNPDVCGDSDSDTCDDCAVGSDNFGALSDSLPANDGTDTDGDGLCDAGDACNGSNASGDTDSDGTCNNLDSDDDNDGVADGSDSSSLNPDVCADSDGDACDDCAVGSDDFGALADNLPGNDGADADADGLCDAGDLCFGNNVSGDSDGDEICNNLDDRPLVASSNFTGALGPCTNGGVQIQVGLDADNSNTLAPSEVTNTSYACSGADGVGVAFASTILTPDPAVCSAGGVQLQFGVDDDGDSILDAGELDVTHVLCSGRSSLVNVSALAPSATCPDGGALVESGIDLDGDGTLDPGEVLADQEVCSGLPTVARTTALAADPLVCPRGGVTIELGVDDDGDGTLDNGEVDASEHQRADDIIRASSDWVWETDRDGRLTYVSDRIVHSLALPAMLLQGRRLDEVVDGPNGSVLATGPLATLQPFRDLAVHARDARGLVRQFALSGVPTFDETGTFRGFRGTGTDVTERVAADSQARRYRGELEKALGQLRQRNEELDHALQDAQAATRAKSEFLAVMSHELRTPLNAIIGFSEIMSHALFGPLNARYLDYVNDILRSGRHLLNLINDILDFARIENQTLRLQTEPVPVREFIGDALTLVEIKAAEKGLTLVRPSLHLDARVKVDRTRALQIIENLLSNALKFTPAGGTIGIEIAQPEDGRVRISIWDTGKGVPLEKQVAIFEMFEQAHSGALARGQEGLGLGLTIARALARQMGGDIVLESSTERGSRFSVVFPIA